MRDADGDREREVQGQPPQPALEAGEQRTGVDVADSLENLLDHAR